MYRDRNYKAIATFREKLLSLHVHLYMMWHVNDISKKKSWFKMYFYIIKPLIKSNTFCRWSTIDVIKTPDDIQIFNITDSYFFKSTGIFFFYFISKLIVIHTLKGELEMNEIFYQYGSKHCLIFLKFLSNS